ncbi:MAG TPA: hypothetical protein DCS54_01205 [Oribacterium sp.]|nr:hypothetical protein [Oribacterium sp.]
MIHATHSKKYKQEQQKHHHTEIRQCAAKQPHTANARARQASSGNTGNSIRNKNRLLSANRYEHIIKDIGESIEASAGKQQKKCSVVFQKHSLCRCAKHPFQNPQCRLSEHGSAKKDQQGKSCHKNRHTANRGAKGAVFACFKLIRQRGKCRPDHEIGNKIDERSRHKQNIIEAGNSTRHTVIHRIFGCGKYIKIQKNRDKKQGRIFQEPTGLSKALHSFQRRIAFLCSDMFRTFLQIRCLKYRRVLSLLPKYAYGKNIGADALHDNRKSGCQCKTAMHPQCHNQYRYRSKRTEKQRLTGAV